MLFHEEYKTSVFTVVNIQKSFQKVSLAFENFSPKNNKY